MDMSHRIAQARLEVIYEPLAVVHHFVPASRTTWHYFWRRCYLVNQGKVEAFANMQAASNLRAELSFVTRTLSTGVVTEFARSMRGDLYGFARIGAMIAGIALAGLGHVSGTAAAPLVTPSCDRSSKEAGFFVSEQVEREIEAMLGARTGRECVFMPSGRFAVYLAFRCFSRREIASSCRRSRTIPCSSAPSQPGSGR